MKAGRALALLREGEIELLGLLPRASNYTFAARVSDGELSSIAVYKPRAGETPLWDFPEGTLWAREIAAYEVSEALGWGLVPPTVAREGPHGIGSLQMFVDAQPEQHYLTLMPGHAGVFRCVAAFDIVCNNADRKSGHCLLERGTERIFVVDHGTCFAVEPKLRTVIWEFVGEGFDDDVAAGLDRLGSALAGPLGARLAALLSPEEADAARARAGALRASGRFPEPDEGRRPYPWPPI